MVVNAPLTPPLALPEQDNLTFTVDVPIESVQFPEASSGAHRDARVTYALTGVPAELSFDPNTRQLSGTPQGIGSVHLCTIVTYINQSRLIATRPFRITVNSLNLPAVADQTYRVGTAITELRLPAVTDDDGTITYRLTGRLPVGLRYHSGSRTLRGIPSEAGSVFLSYEATQGRQGASRIFSVVTIEAAQQRAVPPLTTRSAGNGTGCHPWNDGNDVRNDVCSHAACPPRWRRWPEY